MKAQGNFIIKKILFSKIIKFLFTKNFQPASNIFPQVWTFMEWLKDLEITMLVICKIFPAKFCHNFLKKGAEI